MKFLRKIRVLVAAVMAIFVLAAPVVVMAQAAPATNSNKAAVCDGVALTGGDCAADAEGNISGVVKGAINIFSVLVGIVSVIMIMVGGFKYITSQGDANSIGSAKNTILYAVVGLVVVALAQIIVQFTLNKTQTAVTPPTPGQTP